MGVALTTADTMLCPHGGQVRAVPGQVRAAAGAALLRADDGFVVLGCPFVLGIPPHPCVTVSWVLPARRLSAGGSPVLTTDAVGQCKAADQAVQGVVIVAPAQARVTSR